MPVTVAPQVTIEAYLSQLRSHLRSLPQEQIADIVEEIRSHLRDAAVSEGAATEASVDTALRQLGSPTDLAASYLTDKLLARGRVSSWPWIILRAIFRWATLSAKGFLVLLICTLGYAIGVSFFLVALLKPFYRNAGLWLIDQDSYSLALGATDATRRGHELLGMKIIPIGLALGGGTILLTTHFALWCIRRFRTRHPVLKSGIAFS